MKNLTVNLLFVAAMCLLLVSCKSSKDVAYLQSLSINGYAMPQKDNHASLYEVRFKPKDLLSITVVTSEASASKNYNMLMPQVSDENNGSLYGMPSIQTYLVDNEGYIEFPIIGKIKVSGLSRKELEAYIQKELAPAFSKEHPIINIRITNYAINILGEVSRPGKYQSANDRLTIFEGLALAGDMTIYGRRNNVKILRESADGQKMLINVNLNDKDIIYSQAYYLEQNDVVYVEPNNSKSRSSNINAAETLTVSGLSIVISIASLLVNILM